MRETWDGRQPANEVDVLILGPMPPPFGGVSVHVSRLVALLADAGFTVGVLNHFRATDAPFVVGALKRNPLNYYRLPKKHPARIVHYHHSRWSQLVALALGRRSSSARYMLTLHGGDIRHHFPQLISRLPLVSRITRWAIRRFDVIIAVDPKIAEVIREHTDNQRVEVIPAFLASADEDPDPYEPSFEAFVSRGRVLVVAAFRVQFLKDGRDLYGLDTAVEAFAMLATERDDLQLALFIARRPSRRKARRHLEHLEQRLAQAGVSDRVRVVFGLSLPLAFRSNTVFIRPTRAEGDAVSVREAQQAGVQVVASDVVGRPLNVLTFRAESVEDLCATLRPLLDQPARKPRAASQTEAEIGSAESFSDTLLRLYRAELT
jgi:glycosyltransferase involved in cell wall biosynthesis